MHCTRCNAAHKPDNQLVTTEQGLLCPACVRVVNATFATNGNLGPMLWDEEGPIIDPLYDPYEEVYPYAPHPNFLREAFERTLRELTRPVVDAEKPVSLSEMTMNILANYGLEEHLQKCLEDAEKRALSRSPLVAQWNEGQNE